MLTKENQGSGIPKLCEIKISKDKLKQDYLNSLRKVNEFLKWNYLEFYIENFEKVVKKLENGAFVIIQDSLNGVKLSKYEDFIKQYDKTTNKAFRFIYDSEKGYITTFFYKGFSKIYMSYYIRGSFFEIYNETETGLILGTLDIKNNEKYKKERGIVV
jgi:hypothetical protein